MIDLKYSFAWSRRLDGSKRQDTILMSNLFINKN